VRVAVAIAAALVSTQGCARSSGEPGDASAGDVDLDAAVNVYSEAACAPNNLTSAPTYAPTYDAIWNEILLHTCATEFCHAGSADYLHLYSEATGYPALVGAPAQGPLCARTGLLRVDPFHPETSLMYLKITTPPCGAKMPLSYGCYLDAMQIEQIREGIAGGALDGDAGGSEAGVEGGAGDADTASGEASVDALPE